MVEKEYWGFVSLLPPFSKPGEVIISVICERCGFTEGVHLAIGDIPNNYDKKDSFFDGAQAALWARHKCRPWDVILNRIPR